MKIIIPIFLITSFILAGCIAEQPSGPDFATAKPPLLRAIDNSILSVVVRIDDQNPDYTGEQRSDGSWFVRMNISLDDTHTFVAKWYASTKGQRVLVLEQRGEFFASATSLRSQATSDDISEGDAFDEDCDGLSNLAEMDADSDPLDPQDPLSSSGCSNSESTDNGVVSDADGTSDMSESQGTSDASGGTSDTSDTNGSADSAGSQGTSDASSATDAGSSDTGGGTNNTAGSNTTSGADTTSGSNGLGGPEPSRTMPDLVELTGGCFPMGSATDEADRQDDERQHEVCVEPFAIGLYEVTYDQYNEFAGSPGVVQSSPHDNTWGMGRRPVINAVWRDAVAYTQWLSELTGDTYRLPTEAEWEYAARGGTQTRFWSGAQLRDDQEHFGSANPYGGGVATGQPFRDRTIPVGSLQPNPFGLYDMLGNVIEFTCSLYSANYENDLEKQCDNDMTKEHVLRGAAYSYIATWARSATRNERVSADQANGHVGFRVVRENR